MKKLTAAQTTAMEAIKADAAKKGYNSDLAHGAADTSIATLRALRGAGLIRFDNIAHNYYETRGPFGRGNYRRHYYTSFSVTLLED